MAKKFVKVTFLVRDYDEAIEYFVKKLSFTLVEDTLLTADKRWVVVTPDSGAGCDLLLAKATSSLQDGATGNQTGNRVAFFLGTTDFRSDYELFKRRGVNFIEEPREEIYGRVVVFKDLYGNKWDLVEDG